MVRQVAKTVLTQDAKPAIDMRDALIGLLRNLRWAYPQGHKHPPEVLRAMNKADQAIRDRESYRT